jgi:hypothetical protein
MKNVLLFGMLAGLLVLQSCGGFFDEKPQKSLVVPQNLDDFQAILDAKPRAMNSSLSAGLMSSDELFLSPPVLARLSYALVSAYFWRDEFYLPDENDPSWNTCYRKVFHANLVIDGLKDYNPTSRLEEERMAVLEASARFFRAQGHFEAVSHFAPYSVHSAPDPLGVPVRLTSDLNLKVGRLSQAEVYRQIMEDLEFGISILPTKPDVPTRPSAWAAHAMLSRVHHYRQNYEASLFHAEKALGIGDGLMDYGSLDSTLTYSFEIFHPEVIFYGELLSGTYAASAATYVNPDLVELYGKQDYRPFYFFKKSAVDTLYNFKGHYTGDYFLFGGLAVNEMVLNKAEAALRLGQEAKAVESLNYLLSNRLVKEAFEPIIGEGENSLLQRILNERRKELVFRGTRWLDLRRLNTDPNTEVTLSRNYNEEKSILPPRDIRYVLPIPPLEISLNGLQQNPR